MENVSVPSHYFALHFVSNGSTGTNELSCIYRVPTNYATFAKPYNQGATYVRWALDFGSLQLGHAGVTVKKRLRNFQISHL